MQETLLPGWGAGRAVPPFLPLWLQWEEAAEPLARGSRGGSRAEEELPKWPGRDSSPR